VNLHVNAAGQVQQIKCCRSSKARLSKAKLNKAKEFNNVSIFSAGTESVPLALPSGHGGIGYAAGSLL
jgi:hypothetical protein